VQGVHIVYKVCIDKGETTSGNLKRDSVEPSSVRKTGPRRNKIKQMQKQNTEDT
jgi:hypothetical protein